MINSSLQQIEEAVDYVQSRWSVRPRVGVILGTGLGGFAREIDVQLACPYDQVPHFPRSTAVGHRGQLCCGSAWSVPIITMEGRFHLYEGYSAWQITLPVRVMRRLGIELLIVSNASGGLHPELQVGDIVILEDHINVLFDRSLLGMHEKACGPRLTNLNRPYAPELVNRALATARRRGFRAMRGTYVAVRGPNYETRAEYRFFRKIGGDVIGMSTVPEVIVAAQLGLPVLAVSTVTNICRPDCLTETDGLQVAQAAASAESKLRWIVQDALEYCCRSSSAESAEP